MEKKSRTKDFTWHDPRLVAHFIGEAEVVGIEDSRDKVMHLNSRQLQS